MKKNPQGSVLGPKLFSIYTSELNEVVCADNVKLLVYADDPYVNCAADNSDELTLLVQRTMKKQKEWLTELGMVKNTSKTEIKGCH